MQEFKVKNASVVYQQDLQCIEVTYQGYVQKEDFRNLWRNALEIALQNRCFSWLLNHRNMTALAEENYRWILNEWYPRLKKAMPGINHVATIHPKDTFGMLLSRQMMIELSNDTGFVNKAFASPDEAKHWLLVNQGQQLQVA